MLFPRATLATLALPLLLGCQDLEGEQPLPVRDYDVFVDQVQPIIADRCANPSCHGNNRAVPVFFASKLHRLDSSDTFLDEPLTPQELERNHLAALGFLLDLEDPSESPLLLKPLAVEAGGTAHGGGAQFAEPEDWQYVVMLAWISDDAE